MRTLPPLGKPPLNDVNARLAWLEQNMLLVEQASHENPQTLTDGVTFTGTDVVLGTIDGGAGVEIPMTAAGRALAALGTAAADKVAYFTSATVAAFTNLTAGGRALLGLTGAADGLPYYTSSSAGAVATFTAQARSLLDDASQGAMQTTLGLVPGTNVQAYDADLAAIAALSPANDDVAQRKSGAWTNRTMAQLLVDLGYSTGTCTLEIDASDDVTGQVYSTQIGRYVKFGKLVIVWGTLVLTDRGTGGGVTLIRIKGFPFTSATVSGVKYDFAISYDTFNTSGTAYTQVAGRIPSNATYAELYEFADTAAEQALAWSRVTDTTKFAFTAVYEAA